MGALEDTRNTRATRNDEQTAEPASLFSSVRRVRSFDDVVRQIRHAVLSGKIAFGERLPSERDLAVLLDVSRPTLREGVRALEAEGLIEIRLGSSGGIYASAPDGQLIGSALESLMLIRSASRWELQEFRRAFEPENANLAALRAIDVDIEALHESEERLRSAITSDLDDNAIVAAESAFHEAVAAASHNEVRVAIMMGISQASRRTFETLAATSDAEDMHAALTKLGHVVDAIEAVDPEAARVGMLSYLALL